MYTWLHTHGDVHGYIYMAAYAWLHTHGYVHGCIHGYVHMATCMAMYTYRPYILTYFAQVVFFLDEVKSVQEDLRVQGHECKANFDFGKRSFSNRVFFEARVGEACCFEPFVV